ncbi:histidine phosphatase family protein [Planococcus sp. CPCC 101016]|uniref:histidine phosphatase family protein n=1 Tax=Planococcus sp. CPCC 101016 TaxID=2599617 RepID=UPI0011B61E60|nr:histidine phosphatase family protein [Planococcus sp. CPCC 101016]TWT08238.1 histidine phosphatase family protein [Planococcus sp. CPCC 101016]
MNTFVYMVRHGESPKEGNERTRGLTEKGRIDAQQLTATLNDEEINVVISSPYIRSILTVERTAQQIGKEVLVFEGLKERVFSSEDERISETELLPLLEKSFSVPNYALNGGESNADCQKRAVKVLKDLLASYQKKKIVIGTHGVVMTLMMNFYDDKYNLDFLQNLTKPDIYKMEFNEQELVTVQRLRSGNIKES